MTSTYDDQQLLTGSNEASITYNGNKTEKRPFLPEQMPVSLTPSWESQKLTNDELNLKGMTMYKAQMSMKAPIDKWKIVLFIFLLHGLGTLMPWNMFINAKSYFQDFKLNTTSNDAVTYSTNFMQYIGFASQIPNLIFNWLNIFVNLGGDLTKRIVYSILFEIVVFIITVILAMVDSSDWAVPFFWITIISVILINMANGVYQNTIYGMVAILPIQYTGIVVLGSNISGCFASIMSICSSLVFTSERTAAIYYFITAILILLVCFDTYFALPLNKFFRHHQMLSEKEAKNKTDLLQKTGIPYWKIFKQASQQLFNIFFTFFVTLAIFPAIHSDIKPTHDDFFIPEKLFTAVTCFLTFNLFAMLGSLATSWIQWPNSKYLVIPVTLRAVFIPLFLFCNYRPNNITRGLPVYIHSEWIYWSLGVIMSFSSGYLSSLGMMYAPQTVDPKHQITAGMFAAAMLITGIFSGIMFSFIFPIII